MIAEYNEPIAIKIAGMIQERGLKQGVVAQKAHLSPKDFNNMLRGRKIIKVCDVPKIASALGVTPNDLYEA